MNKNFLLLTKENFEAALPPEFSLSMKAEIIAKYQPVFNTWLPPEDLVDKIMSGFLVLNISGRRYFIRFLECLIDTLEFENNDKEKTPEPVRRFRRLLTYRKEIFCKSDPKLSLSKHRHR